MGNVSGAFMSVLQCVYYSLEMHVWRPGRVLLCSDRKATETEEVRKTSIQSIVEAEFAAAAWGPRGHWACTPADHRLWSQRGARVCWPSV
jgi:hypothetical protein